MNRTCMPIWYSIDCTGAVGLCIETRRTLKEKWKGCRQVVMPRWCIGG
jgi:hypothetical protein